MEIKQHDLNKILCHCDSAYLSVEKLKNLLERESDSAMVQILIEDIQADLQEIYPLIGEKFQAANFSKWISLTTIPRK